MNIGQWVHFGVEGVIECFKWIYENKPNSIFEEPMLAKIKKWKLKYGLSCSLYIIEQSGEFNIRQLQDIYWKELMEESSWLKLSWQGKSDIVTDDLNEELASLHRVFQLIEEKTENTLWDVFAKIRDDKISGELMNSLKNFEIKTFLIDDIEKADYQMTEQERIILKKQGVITKNSINYCGAGVCFDVLKNGTGVCELLNCTERSLEKYPIKPFIDTFFHECRFKEIVLGIDQYWENLNNISIPLIINAGTLVQGQFYFTTCNTSELYAWDIENKEISLITQLPCNSSMKFLALVYYDGCIWMIPACEKNIYVYNIKDKKITIFSLIFLSTEQEEKFMFGGYSVDGKYLWLSPKKTECIMRIDMNKRLVEIFTEWPIEITFNNDSKQSSGVQFDFGRVRNFKVMESYGGKLWLFGDNCNCNVIIDRDTCKMSVWHINATEHYGIAVDENTLLLSPARRHESLRLLCLDTLEENVFSIPDWVWGDERFYAFWYAKRLSDEIYILPRGAKAVIRYCTTDKRVDFIKTDITDYTTLFPSESIAITEIFDCNGGKWMVPYRGNALLMIDEKNKLVKNIKLSIRLQKVKRWYIGLENYEESERFTIIDFICDVCDSMNCDRGEWAAVLRDGKHQSSSNEEQCIIGSEIYWGVV